jgi:prepilin-type processing-associated H-X9-DG protein
VTTGRASTWPRRRTALILDNDSDNANQNSRHTGGATYIFFDGHAKWYKIEATIKPNNLWTIDAND